SKRLERCISTTSLTSLDESLPGGAEALGFGGAVAFKAGRKSGGVGSIQVNALKKEKRCPSESASDGKRSKELFSALKKCGRSVCCADKGRERPRNPAKAESARLVMRESSVKQSREPAKRIDHVR